MPPHPPAPPLLTPQLIYLAAPSLWQYLAFLCMAGCFWSPTIQIGLSPATCSLLPVCFCSSKPHLKSVLSHHRWPPICSHVCLLLASLCNCVRSMRTGTLSVTFSTVFLELRAERSTYSVPEMIFKGRLKTSILYSTSRIQF